MKGVRYVVISPVRNEESFLPLTVESMRMQTVRPAEWIIVDDGSNDGTATAAEQAAEQNDWIRVLRRPDRGFRQPGGGVIDAFYDGFQLMASDDWEFIVKLDGDLSFDPDYFEKCFERFGTDATLGIGGGTICRKLDDRLVSEAPDDPVFHVRGATKIYRRACWDEVGGLIRAPGWDTVDEYRANMLGWATYTFPALKLWHHRPAGGAQGTWKNWVKNGLANYVAGYHPIFMGCKCARRALARPYGVAAIGLMVGFLSGYVRNVPQVGDRDLIRYVRQQQIRRLCFRKSLWDRRPVEGASA